jgi:hypothetical protein
MPGEWKPEIEVKTFKVNVAAAEPGESRPVELVKVELRLLSPKDRISFFLEPPMALELAEKLREVALTLGR